MTHSDIDRHYTRLDLYETIVQAILKSGISLDEVNDHQLSRVDAFHLRGLEATAELAEMVGFSPHENVLDVGCGIGGACRYIQSNYGCQVTGIDLTEEYVLTAGKLSDLVGQTDINFVCGSALSMPFKDAVFDVVWTQHVQMNIEDKWQFYGEIKRVLKPGGRLVYYDILKGENPLPLYFPVPWANEATLSYLIEPEALARILEDLQFKPVTVENTREVALDYTRELIEKRITQEIPSIGLNLLMGSDTLLKLRNVLRSLEEGRISVYSGVWTKGNS
ncbi:MAG: class I SAM-dependent methyltransferase [Bacteroidota bacterium]